MACENQVFEISRRIKSQLEKIVNVNWKFETFFPAVPPSSPLNLRYRSPPLHIIQTYAYDFSLTHVSSQ